MRCIGARSRRLLKFLADKSIAGEADDLKEYSIATDGLGKHLTYDPCHNSAVRLQVLRLRQKLAEYYLEEGLEDPILIDLPKGRFRLRFEHRVSAVLCPPLSGAAQIPAIEMKETQAMRLSLVKNRMNRGPRFAVSLCAIFVVVLAIGGYDRLKTGNAKAMVTSYPPGWDADMEELWRPFIKTDRPLIIAVEDFHFL